jgi:2-C-methyl-D-erythritol 4-phosphate cytidylyltransferase
MEIIIPAAGLSTRFPNMRPKYTLTDYTGKMMIEKSISFKSYLISKIMIKSSIVSS